VGGGPTTTGAPTSPSNSAPPTTSPPTSSPPPTTPPPTTSPSTEPPPPPAQGYELPDWLRGTEWSHVPTGSRLVALTFDGGSNADGAASIVRTLRREGIRGTFFLTGRWVRLYPAQARAIAARYPVGDHSDTHPHLPELSDSEVLAELRGAQRSIRQITGVDPRPMFRFPYGSSDARTLRLVNDAGYMSVRWTVDTLGWEGRSAGITVDSIVARVVAGLSPGEIVLMHLGSAPDGSTLDADALPRVIAAIRSHGYGFVTVRRFVGSPP
jgi:peptidoglycan-N-acetylglucosamine deacetylase